MEETGKRVVIPSADDGLDRVGPILFDTRHQGTLTFRLEDFRDLRNLLRRLPQAEDDLGNPLANRSMGIHPRMLGIDKREVGESLGSGLHRQLPGLDPSQYFLDPIVCHARRTPVLLDKTEEAPRS